MSIKSDSWIKRMALEHKIIEPFVDELAQAADARITVVEHELVGPLHVVAHDHDRNAGGHQREQERDGSGHARAPVIDQSPSLPVNPTDSDRAPAISIWNAACSSPSVAIATSTLAGSLTTASINGSGTASSAA